jgi:hypothetical protein
MSRLEVVLRVAALGLLALALGLYDIRLGLAAAAVFLFASTIDFRSVRP